MISWGAVVNFVFMFIENGYSFIHKMTFDNFNIYAVLTVIWYDWVKIVMFSTVYMGLITGAILKYLSSVVKAFTSSASLVITSIISAFVFNLDLSLPFDLAVVNLSIAIYLSKTAPIPKESPKPLPLATEMEEIPTETPRIDTIEEKVIADAIEIGEDEEEIQIRKFN